MKEGAGADGKGRIGDQANSKPGFQIEDGHGHEIWNMKYEIWNMKYKINLIVDYVIDLIMELAFANFALD